MRELNTESAFKNVSIAFSTGRLEILKPPEDTLIVYCEHKGVFETKYLINAAGLNALNIAD